MITKNIKHFIVAGTVCCGFAAALTACSDWDDHYEGSSAASGGNLTLWQQIQANPQLSDFAKVLQETKVVRMHKKTPVSYAQLLDGGQSFTVVAPVNGTFNCDSLLELVKTNQGDSVVEKFFVLNHLSRSTYSLMPEMNNMLLLNRKYVSMGKGTIEGVNISNANLHAANGVLHVSDSPLPYQYNLYEMMCDMPQLSSIGQQLRKYEEDYFDADASVSSGIVEGVPVYIDSVVIERNRMLDRIGYLASEDSVYWAVVPTNEGWQKAWDEVTKYFRYDDQVQKRDSIQHHWTTRALMDDAVFNMTDQKSTQDSLVSVPYLNWRRTWTSGKPVFHVFKNPFAAGGILNGAQRVTCSNGVLYQTSEWPFTPEQTFFKEIWTEAENRGYITAEKDCNYNVRRIAADSISEGSYLQVQPRTSTSNWELTFRMNNTLAGTYDICAIVLPKSVYDQVAPDLRPNKFKATISYVDETGAKKTFNCDNKEFTNSPERVDTIMLAEAFHFPACNYDQNDIKVTVRIQCSITARQTSQYAREMYLDCIYLRPRTDKDE